MQKQLEDALRRGIQELRQDGQYGEKEMDEIRKLGEGEIRALADALQRDLERLRTLKRDEALNTETARRLEMLLAKFNRQATELENTIDAERELVLAEASRIRALSEELLDLRGNKQRSSTRSVVLFFLAWVFGIGALYYLWITVDSGETSPSLTYAALDAAVASVATYLYLNPASTTKSR